jgi:spore coat polysaccharide biosynthesis protein SpsF
MDEFKTKQEEFWAGEFGDEYTSRNQGEGWVASNMMLFAKILARTDTVKTLLEFGANIGLNFAMIKQLLPSAIYGGRNQPEGS